MNNLSLKIAIASVILVGIIYSSSQPAFADDSDADGNDLINYCNALIAPDSNNSFAAGICAGYIEGVDEMYLRGRANDSVGSEMITDPVALLNFMKSKEKNEIIYCRPPDIKFIQIAKLIIKYLDEHPEDLHKYPSLIILNTLHYYFPCKDN